jgi:N-acetylglutamate synthase-like GNAT family acetyltransferase
MTGFAAIGQGTTSVERGIRVREARPEDNRFLIELSEQCPMQADTSLLVERSPDFFALSNVRGRSWTAVVEAEGRPVACASVSRRPAWVSGKVMEMGVIADVKVSPEHRGRGVAGQLLTHLVQVERAAAPAVFLGLTAAGNRSIDGMLHSFGETLPLNRLATFTSYELLPLVPLRVRKDLVIRPATESDRQALVALLSEFHRHYCFGPVFEDGGFEAQLARSPGMDLSSYWLAFRGNVLEAALGTWDQSAFKRIRVLSMPTGMRLGVQLLRNLSAFAPLPKLPTVGDVLRFRYLRHAAHLPGKLDSLSALVRHCVNDARKREDHFVLFTCADTDPLAGAVRGVPRFTYRYGLTAGCNRPEAQALLDAIGNQTFYDDASLS